MSLAQYLKSFSRLRTDKNRKRWSALTTYQAPHKPFLLLSIMDLIAQGSIIKNFIEPSFELLDTFNTYWNSVMSIGSKTSMAYPFPRLKTDGFWHLMPNPGYENQINIDFSSMTKLREVRTTMGTPMISCFLGQDNPNLIPQNRQTTTWI